MPYEYTDYSPIDCSIEPDLSKLKDKSVIVTGGEGELVYLVS